MATSDWRLADLLQRDLHWVMPNLARKPSEIRRMSIHLAYENEDYWQCACGTRLQLAGVIDPVSVLNNMCKRCREYHREIARSTVQPG